MNIKSIRRFLSLFLIMLLAVSVCDAQSFDRPPLPKQQKSVSRKPLKKKEAKIKGPKSVRKVQKKQAANDKKLKKEYDQFVKNNRKRSMEIQTPEVRERMKQNVKDANNRAREKRKNNASQSRKAARKYR